MKYNLFIGRWFPFHKGHKYIIDSYVNNNKPVLIAIRDCDIDFKNPLNAVQKKKLIDEVYKNNPLVKTIIIPDIEEVVVGRNVGYSIAQVPENIKNISATQIRENGDFSNLPIEIQNKLKRQKPYFILLTGLPASGKTTIAKIMANILDEYGYIYQTFDGDLLRKTVSKNLGFSKEDRIKNLQNLLKIATSLIKNNIMVIASFIAPFKEGRELFRKQFKEKYIEIYVNTPIEICKERDKKNLYKRAIKGEIKNFTGISSPYEIPDNPNYIIDNSNYIPYTEIEKIITELIR